MCFCGFVFVCLILILLFGVLFAFSFSSLIPFIAVMRDLWGLVTKVEVRPEPLLWENQVEDAGLLGNSQTQRI